MQGPFRFPWRSASRIRRDLDEVRRCSDALQLVVSDDPWPLPKYREMLFPV